jgi:hypothetical protein
MEGANPFMITAVNSNVLEHSDSQRKIIKGDKRSADINYYKIIKTDMIRKYIHFNV